MENASLIDILLVTGVTVTVFLFIFAIAIDYRLRTVVTPACEDEIGFLKDEIERLREGRLQNRAEISVLTGIVRILSAQLEGAGLTPVAKINGSQKPSLEGLSRFGLRGKIVRYFSEEEIRTIAFDLGLDPDSLTGNAKPAVAMSLIKMADERNLTFDLIALLQKERKNVDWV